MARMHTRGAHVIAIWGGIQVFGLLGCHKPLPPGVIQHNGVLVRVKDRAVMVHVEPGRFLMGRTKETVYLRGFYIDQLEVSNKQYMQFVRAAGHREPEFRALNDRTDDEQPITGVGWFDAAAYAAWVGGRLPTEAEWEKAARGSDGWTYPWGEDPPDDALAVLGSVVKQRYASTVGSKPAGVSPYGCLDMVGNVWEWCADWYSQPGQERAIRGGSFGQLDYGQGECYSRGKAFPEFPQEHIGFRCVVADVPCGRGAPMCAPATGRR